MLLRGRSVQVFLERHRVLLKSVFRLACRVQRILSPRIVAFQYLEERFVGVEENLVFLGVDVFG